MVRQYHQLNGHESEQAQRDSEGQGSLARYSPWACRHDSMPEKQQTRNITEVGKDAGIEFLKISTGNSHVF